MLNGATKGLFNLIEIRFYILTIAAHHELTHASAAFLAPFLKLSTLILKVRLRSCAQEMRFRLRDFFLPEEPTTGRFEF